MLQACEPHSTPEDLEQIRRALTRGCPSEFNWEEPGENKEAFIRRANAPDVALENPDVMKIIKKEERNSHVVCFSRWWCRASAYARATPQTVKEEGNGKKHRLIWDSTTKLYWWEQTMNEMTPTAKEPGITFGMVILLLESSRSSSAPTSKVLLYRPRSNSASFRCPPLLLFAASPVRTLRRDTTIAKIT